MDAIATWFDLHLDEEVSISTSPPVGHLLGAGPLLRAEELGRCPGRPHPPAQQLLRHPVGCETGGRVQHHPKCSSPYPGCFLFFPAMDTSYRAGSDFRSEPSGSMYAHPPPLTVGVQLEPSQRGATVYIERHEMSRLNDLRFMEAYLISLRRAIAAALWI